MNYLSNRLFPRFLLSNAPLTCAVFSSVLLIVSVLSGSVMAAEAAMSGAVADPRLQAKFVGREVCSDCHQQEDQLWQGSHHDWAMKPANDKSVLGDLNNVVFDHYGEKTRFFKKDNKYWVTTDNARGEQETFEVLYTFGFYPL